MPMSETLIFHQSEIQDLWAVYPPVDSYADMSSPVIASNGIFVFEYVYLSLLASVTPAGSLW